MTWTRLSDDFSDREAVALLSADAFRVHVEALIWCNRQITVDECPLPTADQRSQLSLLLGNGAMSAPAPAAVPEPHETPTQECEAPLRPQHERSADIEPEGELP